jgi:hypothetical protein
MYEKFNITIELNVVHRQKGADVKAIHFRDTLNCVCVD